MERMNCWEIKDCGRGPDSAGGDLESVCPAAKTGEYDGVNGGDFAGRFCWAVTGTFCDGNRAQGTFAQKFRNCLNCNFLQQVDVEEGRFMVLTPHEIQPFSSGGVYWK